jgi:hypothetical protein
MMIGDYGRSAAIRQRRFRFFVLAPNDIHAIAAFEVPIGSSFEALSPRRLDGG